MREGLPCAGGQGTPDPLRGPFLIVWHLATVADVETHEQFVPDPR